VFCDPYTRNRMTGGLILIDEGTNATVGAAITECPVKSWRKSRAESDIPGR